MIAAFQKRLQIFSALVLLLISIPLLTVLGTVSEALAGASAGSEIPSAAQGIWKKENGFVVGPEGVIVRLPIPEDDTEALYNAGVAAAGNADWKAAIAYFTAAQQRAHLVPKYMYNLALAHEKAGHEVMAIAWYTSYLIADPKAPNRSAVWTAIKSLEASARKKIDIISNKAIAAADNLPMAGDGFGHRSDTFYWLAESKARTGEYEQQKKMAEKSASYSINKSIIRTADNVLSGLKWQPLQAAIEDNDLPAAEAIVKLHKDSAYLEELTRLRKGKIANYLVLGKFSPLHLDEDGYAYEHQILKIARSGNMDRLGPVVAELAKKEDAGEGEKALALVAQGRTTEALNALPELKYNGFSGAAKESDSADVAELLLLIGDLKGAEKAAGWAKKHINRQASASSGWSSTRIESLILAEKGKTSQAIDLMDSFLTRKSSVSHSILMSIGSGSFSPTRAWTLHRYDGRANVAEYLLWRGRVDEALEIAKGLDTLRQIRFLDYIDQRVSTGTTRYPREKVITLKQAALAQATNGASAPSDSERQHIENAILIATAMPGAVYDLDWWLKLTEKIATAEEQPGNLMRTAEELSRGLRRIRVAYERTGETWGK